MLHTLYQTLATVVVWTLLSSMIALMVAHFPRATLLTVRLTDMCVQTAVKCMEMYLVSSHICVPAVASSHSRVTCPTVLWGT